MGSLKGARTMKTNRFDCRTGRNETSKDIEPAFYEIDLEMDESARHDPIFGETWARPEYQGV